MRSRNCTTYWPSLKRGKREHFFYVLLLDLTRSATLPGLLPFFSLSFYVAFFVSWCCVTPIDPIGVTDHQPISVISLPSKILLSSHPLVFWLPGLIQLLQSPPPSFPVQTRGSRITRCPTSATRRCTGSTSRWRRPSRHRTFTSSVAWRATSTSTWTRSAFPVRPTWPFCNCALWGPHLFWPNSFMFLSPPFCCKCGHLGVVKRKVSYRLSVLQQTGVLSVQYVSPI